MSLKSYVIFGSGPDSVGLVRKVTDPIAEAGGNIVDLRQDVMHGLFTVCLVLNVPSGKPPLEELRGLVGRISDGTGLQLQVEPYSPVPRSPELRNLLLILLGRDRPGVIATISESLSRYGINIEFSRAIGREDVFLMELMTDISQCSLPLENLKTVLCDNMRGMNIETMFQAEDVFNKAKRIILFDIGGSFLTGPTHREILVQAKLGPEALTKVCEADRPEESLQAAAAALDGLPAAVARSVVEGFQPTPGTLELIQTLKVMGYRVALSCRAFPFFTDWLQTRLDLDHVFGCGPGIDADSQTVEGELQPAEPSPFERGRVVAELMTREGVEREVITVIDDAEPLPGGPPGLRLTFDMKGILGHFNEGVLSSENLVGLLGSFGLPRMTD